MFDCNECKHKKDSGSCEITGLINSCPTPNWGCRQFESIELVKTWGDYIRQASDQDLAHLLDCIIDKCYNKECDRCFIPHSDNTCYTKKFVELELNVPCGTEYLDIPDYKFGRNPLRRECGNCAYWKEFSSEEYETRGGKHISRIGNCSYIKKGTKFAFDEEGGPYEYDGYSFEDELYDEYLHCFVSK